VDDVLLWLQTHAFRKRAAIATPRAGEGGEWTSRQLHRQRILDELGSIKVKTAARLAADAREQMEMEA
jgi:hypothetical protein